MRTLQSLVDDVFLKEGDVYAGPPTIDQPTGRGGIVLATIQAWNEALNLLPEPPTVEDLRRLTRSEAEAIVQWKLEQLSKEMQLDYIRFEPLRLHLLDFGYNSGGPRAIRWLQRVLLTPRSGRLDGVTLTTLNQADSRLVHQALIAARLQMVDEWTDADAKRKMWEEGLENRILSFSLLPKP